MTASTHDLLANAWFVLIGLMLAFYVITDGFDLGVGILSLFTRREDQRDQIFASIAHVWDANETWLVVLGGALFGAFPAAYAALMSQLYLPVMGLVASLILRGAAIEFRHAARDKRGWDLAFGLGSLGAALGQGVVLGRLITGLAPGAGSLAFVAAAALGVTAGYALLGAGYLLKKTGGALARRARGWVGASLAATLAMAAVLTAFTLFFSDLGRQRWTQPGAIAVLAALGALALLAAGWIVYALFVGDRRGPFRGALLLFLASFAGLAFSLFPNLVPGRLTVLQAASDSTTLVFMLLGIGFAFPIMIGYNLYQYHAFRGQVAQAPHS
ncbi:cytochrome d ubiquinol oxidase subunit II [uncultured Massilia sp.]|uniref:cytochrome d ubiquinol oxidase subunit II n=1 Tax=uncultured Massilia sp. TaxID=169973 RepID=UPI0026011464|nr:cytochrome d ubiquinol oxidase subunit II [uncultured Massilia sp.]